MDVAAQVEQARKHRPRRLAPLRPRDSIAPIVLFLGAHAVFGVIVTGAPGLARVQYMATLVVAVGIGIFARRVELIAAVAGYVAASDVFWRMATGGEQVFWEGAKYGVVVVLGLGLLRRVRSIEGGVLPIVYVALLLPAAAITVDSLSLSDAREAISFNLSGPLALAVAVLFFQRLTATYRSLRTVFVAVLGPIVAVATIALVEFQEVKSQLEFSDESNFGTSGGYGPNQVSNLLALGALLCFLATARERRPGHRFLFGALGLWLFGQSLFTFSRSGAYGLTIAVVVALLVALVRSKRRAPIVLGAGLAIVACLGVFSWVDGYTGGALGVRFSDRGTTGRSDLAAADLELFRDHTLFGVGPGMAEFERTSQVEAVEAHTEFTRLLAEHGILGAAAGIVLVVLGVSAVARQPTAYGAAASGALATWSLVTMTNAAMRIAIISFAFGLAFLRLREPTVRRAPPLAAPGPRAPAGRSGSPDARAT